MSKGSLEVQSRFWAPMCLAPEGGSRTMGKLILGVSQD